jgi:glucose-6-phosphate dehydrogenase assembly protein OpcA
MAEAGLPVNAVFLEGETLAVDSQQIEMILRQLWKAGQHGEQSVTRACMLNLVVYAGTPENAVAATAALAELTATLLCRAIVLLSDEAADEPSTLQAWLSAHCQAPKATGQRVCCEQVTLRTTGEADERLPSAVLPLLVPDLPVAVWWMGDPPFGAPVFEQLLDTADRLLVDTRSFEDPTFSLTRLAGLARHHAGRIAISDLNWARLTTWQDQLAQAFDSVETLPYLDRLERLTLHYIRPTGTTRHDPEMALLLAGWVLNRIGWKLPPALARVGGGPLPWPLASGGP